MKVIPEIKLPSEDELRKRAEEWLSRCQHTLYDQWPESYKLASTPTRLIEVDPTAFSLVWGDDPRIHPYHVELADTLDQAIGWDVKFLRLNSRSPKDATWPFEKTPWAMGGKQSVNMIAASERCLEDISKFSLLTNQPCYICLRDLERQMDMSREFRCFIKDRQLIAVTAYNYAENRLEAAKNRLFVPRDGGKAIRGMIDKYISSIILPELPSDNLVVDLLLKSDGLMLIEINPYGLSDPCFFGNYKAVETANTFVQYAPPEESEE